MKHSRIQWIGSAMVAAVLAGCSPAENPKPTTPDNKPPAAAAPPASVTPNQPSAATATLTTPSPTPAASISTSVSELGKGLMSLGKSSADSTLRDIGAQLGTSAQSLLQSLSGNSDLKSAAESAVGSLLGGKDSQVMGLYQKLGAAQLTEPQSRLFKEVKDLSAAYLTQKNFAGLPGAEGDVTKLVSAFRTSDYTGLLAPLKNIYGNATLTAPQKEMVGSLVDSYAPALKKYGETLNKGLNSLNSLGK
ncbi:MAG: hypothetical protein H7X97_08210 [Opitutaceae bacterium]|nr:hypothetical protein [Verrucomicrobiales bacterium]